MLENIIQQTQKEYETAGYEQAKYDAEDLR